jgi:ribose transport system permease protein
MSVHGTTAAPRARSRRRSVPVIALAERFALVGLLALLVVFFSAYGPTSSTFFTTANIQSVLGNESVVAIAALAVVLPLIGGQFDVSVGAVVGLSSIVAASALSHGWPLAAAIAAAVAISAVVGLVNGLLVAYVGVNSFITTLAAGTLIGGLVSLYTNNETITQGIPTALTDFGTSNALGVPCVVWVVVVVAIVLAFLIGWTVHGRELTSVGASPPAARLVGIRVDAIIASSFVISSALAGVAGVVLLSRTGTGNPQIGSGYTLAALSAAFLGATALKPGQFNVPGTLVGVLFVAVSVNGLTLAGAKDWVDPVFNGAALMLAVALSTILGRMRASGSGNVHNTTSGETP